MLKPFKRFHGKMFRVSAIKSDKMIIETKNEEEALFIMTRKHKPRCPHCKAPKCIQNWIFHEFTLKFFMSAEPESLGEIPMEIILDDSIFAVCLCLKKDMYFLTLSSDDHPEDLHICKNCGSKKNELHPVLNFKRKESYRNEELSRYGHVRSWKLLSVFRINCTHCKYDGFIGVRYSEDDKQNIMFNSNIASEGYASIDLFLTLVSQYYDIDWLTKDERLDKLKKDFQQTMIK